jgi:hypothetical protein
MAGEVAFRCHCGKGFVVENAYGKHQRTCQRTKKRLLGALGKTKEIWAEKRRKLIHKGCSTSTSAANEPLVDSSDLLANPELPARTPSSPLAIPQVAVDESFTSLAQRRPRRQNISLPMRFRDILPRAAPSLPPTVPRLDPCSTSLDASPESDAAAPPRDPSPLRSRMCRIFRTPRNIFGLVRQYFAEQLPSVDPEEHITLADLSPPSSADKSSQQPSSLYPFPNKSSFLLGNWYWNGGVQKSQESFKELIDIVGDPSFQPDHVRHTKWTGINAKLGSSDADGDAEGEWLDADAGWRKTRVEITVPFHSRMKTPGSQQYVGADLYHRSLVEVITERISDPHTGAQFHLEPYELLWKRSDLHREVNIHGELYTSEAFREAHQALQDSPPEPNCDLPRVVVALMFWSDATHLTQFGNSQLWPSYLFIGNESKYRRCKPSCNLCSHVAYFQKVDKSQIYSLDCPY